MKMPLIFRRAGSFHRFAVPLPPLGKAWVTPAESMRKIVHHAVDKIQFTPFSKVFAGY
jgi:hypothetical protein